MTVSSANGSPAVAQHRMRYDVQAVAFGKVTANVEFLKFGELDAILGDLIDVTEAQHEMEDLNCRWNLGPNAAEVPQTTRDVVPFRAKRR